MADPAQVPSGQQPWFASFSEWRWLQIAGAPARPPYAAAEVVVGSYWCIGNSGLGEVDWVYAVGGERFRMLPRTAEQLLIRMLRPAVAARPDRKRKRVRSDGLGVMVSYAVKKYPPCPACDHHHAGFECRKCRGGGTFKGENCDNCGGDGLQLACMTPDCPIHLQAQLDDLWEEIA